MEPINMFECFCSFRSEGYGGAPLCKHCGKQMRHWNTRTPSVRSNVMTGETTDKRTENGGY